MIRFLKYSLHFMCELGSVSNLTINYINKYLKAQQLVMGILSTLRTQHAPN